MHWQGSPPFCQTMPKFLILGIFLTLGSLAAPLKATEPSQGPGAGRSLYEIRTDNVVLQEWDLSCGAAALATLLRYQHGEPVTERKVALGLIDRPAYYENPDLLRVRHGFSFLDMKRYLAKLGYDGVGLGEMRFRDLLERAPLIVPIEQRGFPHFVVFRGATRNRVLLADPAFGNVTVPRDEFQEAWLDYGRLGKVGFVVQKNGKQAPPGALIPLAREFRLLR